MGLALFADRIIRQFNNRVYKQDDCRVPLCRADKLKIYILMIVERK